MLYKQTTTPFLYKTLNKLMKIPEFTNFRLVGGTGLSLQLGHRKSIDIDLFSDIEFNINNYKFFTRKIFPKSEIRTSPFGITFYLATPDKKQLKIDIMETENFIRPIQNIDNIRFAHIEDIAAMKLEAITTRNTKKDFYDIAELLEKYSFEQLLNFYSEKYPYNDIKEVLENITFFSEDCENEFEPDILNNKDWISVKFLLQDIFSKYIEKQLENEFE